MTINKAALKDKLLATGSFIDNNYLDKYVELIAANQDRTHEKFKTQRHHILPVAYFKTINITDRKLNKDILDTDNIVILLFSDHVLAHFYLSYCTTGFLKYSNLVAFGRMFSGFQKQNPDSIISDITLDKIQELYSEWRRTVAEDPERNNKISKSVKDYYSTHEASVKGKIRCYTKDGKIFYADECPPDCTTIMPDSLKKPVAEEVKNKIRAGVKDYYDEYGHPNVGKHWYTDGTNNVLCKSEDKPEGWTEGMVHKNKVITIFKQWVSKL